MRPPPLPPDTGSLPTAFTAAMLFTLLRCLPAPMDGEPDGCARQTIWGALEMVRLLAPADVLEAHLVLQLVIAQVQAPLTEALALIHQAQPEVMFRTQRHAMAQQRAAGALERRLAAYRRMRGPAAEAVEMWDYELAPLEEAWREQLDLREEARAEAEAAKPPPPAPATKREKEVLPPWGKKRHWHELTDEELAAVREAERRGENPGITHAPGDPAIGFKLLPPREKYRGWENMTMAERKARWGYRSEAEIAADAARAVEGAPLKEPTADEVEAEAG